MNNNPLMRRPVVNNTNRGAPRDQNDRCYNCQEKGHRARDCVQPRRSAGVCFTCQKPGHSFRNCTEGKSKEAAKQVAVVTVNNGTNPEDEEDAAFMQAFEDSLKTMESVSVTFPTKFWRAQLTNVNVLYDTGSPCNFIRRSAVPDDLCGNTLTVTEYSGLGNCKLSAFGKVEFELNIRQRIRKISAFVVPDEVLHVQLLLGRNGLRLFNITLHMDLEAKLKRLFTKTKCLYANKLREARVTARNKAACGSNTSQGIDCTHVNLVQNSTV